MIKPDNKTRFVWELVVLVVTIFVLISIPVSIVFYHGADAFDGIIDVVITVIFGLDILIHFKSAIIIKRQLIEDPREIRKIYFKRWFWIDLLAAFPFYLILGVIGLGIGGAALQFFRLPRLLKIFRAMQTLQKTRTSNVFNPNVARMALLIFWTLILAHFIACTWILIEGRTPDQTDGLQYLRALYWTITTLATIGYGDITPKTSMQMIFAMFIELIGAGLFGFIIGNIATLIAKLDIARAQHQEKVERINTFMQYRNIPLNLQQKVNDYYSYLWDTRKGHDESSVLHELPTSLKQSVSIYLNKENIEKVSIFKGAGDALIKDIILNLEPVVFTPHDYVIRKGEIGNDMYFISNGSVDVVSEDEKTIYATLTAGQFFGEMALLLSSPRTATIKTREYCDLYRLDKDTLDKVLVRYPEFAEKLKQVAERRRIENESSK